jgi:hypothetical protein
MLADVCFGSLGDIAPELGDVRFTPDSDQKSDIASCPLSANSCHMHRSN